jgi:hypothetical protein
MDLVVTERKEAGERIESYYGVAIIVEVAVILPGPIVHLNIILIIISTVVSHTEKHMHEIGWMSADGIKEYFAVVKIFEDICCTPVFVIKGVDSPKYYPSDDF